VINGYVSICHEAISGNCSKKNCKFIISVLKNFNGNFFFIIITKLIEAILFYQQIQISPSALFYYVFSFLFLVQCFIFSLLNRFEEEEEKEYPVCIRNLLRDKTFHLWYCCVKKWLFTCRTGTADPVWCFINKRNDWFRLVVRFSSI